MAMSANVASFVQFFTIAVAVSIIAHSLSRRLEVASGTAAAVAAVVTIIFWSIRHGFDGWYIIGLVTLFGLGAAIAFPIGFIFRLARARRDRGGHAA
jgi:hypothetical protein